MLQGALEDNVLTLLCWSDAHAPDLMLQLRPDLFSTRAFRKIAERAFAHIERYGAAPGAHMRDICEADLRKGDEGKLLRQTLDAMETLQASLQPEFVLAELGSFIESRKLAQALEGASDALHSGDIDKAKELLYAKELLPNHSPGLKMSDAGRMLAYLDRVEEDFFSIGIDVLDEKGVRPERKTLTMLIASSGKGKTWWMGEVAKRNFMHRKNITHITLEMSEEKVGQRYIQTFYGMTKKEAKSIRVARFERNDIGQFLGFEYDTITPEAISHETKAVVARKLRAMRNRAPVIKEFPTGQLTIAQLDAYLDKLEREGYKTDVLILDYLDLMAIDPKDIRTSTGHMVKQLRGLAVRRNLALITASQGNRASDDAKTVSRKHVAEDWSKIGTADTIITYSQTDQEKAAGLARVLVAKAREDEDGWLALLSQAYATGQFCLDSIYMGKHIEEALRDFTGGEDGDSA
jgi:hypothetical protein